MAAFEALRRFESEARANVKRGVYRLADAATAAFERARAHVARYLNAADPSEIVFTSGTTFGLNLAAHTLAPRLSPGRRVVVSRAEHHSNIVPWQLVCERTGAELVPAPLLEDGRIDVDGLLDLLDSRVAVVSITHASNVTGAITHIPRIAQATRAIGAVLVVDGAQAVPHGPVDVRALGCDLYVLSGHKMFGATGAGALWGRKDLLEELPPFLGGGEMIARVSFAGTTYARPPHRVEAGTPPIGPALALGAAAEWLAGLDWAAIRAHEAALTRRLIAGLSEVPGVRILGPREVDGRIGVVAFTLEGVHPHDVCQMLDLYGVCTRGGHHCAQPLMEHFGVEASVRASLALYNSEEDVDALVRALDGVRRRLA
ncbi:Cysteine desulfurase SufS [bacterium HR39]|nr:Cysteine desulfurase SufS [bacterium HR39]